MREEDTMLARSGRTDPGGKLTERLDIPCTEELHEAVIAMATLHGMNKAELVRTMLERAFFGELNMMRRMAGTGSCVNPRNVGGVTE